MRSGFSIPMSMKDDASPLGQDRRIPSHRAVDEHARATMVSQDAVAHFLDPPPEEQNGCGIGVHELIPTQIAGVPAVLGFLGPHAVRQFAPDPRLKDR